MLRDAISGAVSALEASKLTPVEGTWSQGWAETFPALSPEEQKLGQLPGFTPTQEEAFQEAYTPETLGLPTHTGSPIPGDPTDSIISTPVPEDPGPSIFEARPGAKTTPDGNSILPHGAKGDGEEYVTLKGHTIEQIDDIIANPRPELSGYVEGRGQYRGRDVRLITGQDGHWVKVDANGNVFATSNRNLPLRDDENDPGAIIRPSE